MGWCAVPSLGWSDWVGCSVRFSSARQGNRAYCCRDLEDGVQAIMGQHQGSGRGGEAVTGWCVVCVEGGVFVVANGLSFSANGVSRLQARQHGDV